LRRTRYRLYVDAGTLREQAAENGYTVDVVAVGAHYDYLACLKRQKTNKE